MAQPSLIGQTLRFRPDYFLPTGESGVLLETERGKSQNCTNAYGLFGYWLRAINVRIV